MIIGPTFIKMELKNLKVNLAIVPNKTIGNFIIKMGTLNLKVFM